MNKRGGLCFEQSTGPHTSHPSKALIGFCGSVDGVSLARTCSPRMTDPRQRFGEESSTPVHFLCDRDTKWGADSEAVQRLGNDARTSGRVHHLARRLRAG